MVNAISDEHSIFQLCYLDRKQRLWDLLLAFNSGKKLSPVSIVRSKTSLTETVLAAACTNLTPEPSHSTKNITCLSFTWMRQEFESSCWISHRIDPSTTWSLPKQILSDWSHSLYFYPTDVVKSRRSHVPPREMYARMSPLLFFFLDIGGRRVWSAFTIFYINFYIKLITNSNIFFC